MIITCISASNIKHAKDYGTSSKICSLIKEMVIKKGKNLITVELIKLVDYELSPCIGCGKCFKQTKCVYDEGFNYIYSKLVKSDGLFIVSAHYAPIPSKLSMLLEKMEQLAFLPRFHKEEDKSPLYKKPVGIIGHGGGTEEIIKGYKEVVLSTIANALSYPIEMNILGINEEWPNGIVFPIKEVIRDEKSLFPIQKYDWEDIKVRIEPLVNNMIDNIIAKRK